MSSEARRDVYMAIADPTRRAIIDMVCKQPLNVNAIAERFDMTRQAISLHVRILEECGLLLIIKQGRERYCEAKPGKLQEVYDWTDQYQAFWTNRLSKLKKHLEKEHRGSKKK